MTVRPSTLAWVRRHLAAGEHVAGIEVLRGGITAEMRRLTIGTPSGETRELVLRTFVDPFYVERAEDLLAREASALTELADTGVRAPALVGVDALAAHCEFPSLLMTHLPGRTVLDDGGVEARVPALARQLVAIHAVRPTERPRDYVTLTTADTVVVPDGADTAAWAVAIDMIRKPVPPYEGLFLHRDFQPGNVLFDADGRITGVVDWAGASWGPADLDVAHCCVNLALLHGPEWAERFVEAYEEAGGTLAADPDERTYWLVRDALASSEDVRLMARAWRETGRIGLTARVVEERLNAYLVRLLTLLT